MIQIIEVMRYVAKQERFGLEDEAAKEIAEDSNGNLRKALLVFEALKMQSCVHISCSTPTRDHVKS